MKRYYLTGFCIHERRCSINEMEEVVNKHGFLVDFKMFSDVSMSVTIEIQERKVDKFYLELREHMNLKHFTGPEGDSDEECLLMLHVHFAQGTGHLRNELPAVPG